MRKNVIIAAAALLFSLVASAQNLETLDVSHEPEGPAKIEKGDYIFTGTVKNGLKQGTWYEIYASKQLIHKVVVFEQGYRNGLYMEIDETGTLVKKAEYADDLLDGVSYTWYRGGRLSGMNTYKRGILDGEQVKCYEQGGTQEIANYKDGIRDGATTWFDQSGNKKMTIEYKGGKFEGKQETFYSNGQVKSAKMFKDNVQDGESIEYYESGAVKSEAKYKKGTLSGSVKTYQDNDPNANAEKKIKEKDKKDKKDVSNGDNDNTVKKQKSTAKVKKG